MFIFSGIMPFIILSISSVFTPLFTYVQFFVNFKVSVYSPLEHAIILHLLLYIDANFSIDLYINLFIAESSCFKNEYPCGV